MILTFAHQIRYHKVKHCSFSTSSKCHAVPKEILNGLGMKRCKNSSTKDYKVLLQVWSWGPCTYMVQELLVLTAAPSSCGRDMRGLSNPYSSSDALVEPAAGTGLQKTPSKGWDAKSGATRDHLIPTGIKYSSRYESSEGVSLQEVISLMWYILAISREWKINLLCLNYSMWGRWQMPGSVPEETGVTHTHSGWKSFTFTCPSTLCPLPL